MALLVAKNSKIPNEIAIKFIEKLLVDVYNLDLNSKLTQVHWYNSILPTLPFFESLFNPMEDFREFDQLIDDNSTDNSKDRNFKWVAFKTTNGQGATRFIQLNKFTYKLRTMNGIKLFDESTFRSFYPNLAKDDIQEIPMLTIQTNPYVEVVTYDEENDFFTLNTIHPSKYKVNARMNKTKPKNILTQMIQLFFSNEAHEDYYYHWLAHLMFGDKPVNVVMWLCSDNNAEAGTGKTILSAALPAQLIGFDQATTVDSSVATAGWGQIFDTKLLSYNDLNTMPKADWAKMYAKIKDEATNSTGKLRNNKGGDITKSSVGICQSGSSNFIPELDSSDRRFFVVSPKLKLDEDGADELHRIFEAERANEHREIQEIADYLKYLYDEQQDKYKSELFTRALMTAEKTAATQMGTFTRRILPLIAHNPRELFDIFSKKIEYNSEWQEWQIITFIKLQTHKDKVYLPSDFINVLMNYVQDTNEERSTASVMEAIGMKKSKLNFSPYRDLDELKALELPLEVANYKTYGVVIDITVSAYKKFMPKRIVAKGIQALGDR